MVKKITTFIAEDGKEFQDQASAEAHEAKLRNRDKENYDKFIRNSYSGGQLLKKHSLHEYGTWEILGEDSNADFGGQHYQPSLGLFEGTLDQVIRKAVSIPRFYTWGGGGSIRLVNPPEKL